VDYIKKIEKISIFLLCRESNVVYAKNRRNTSKLSVRNMMGLIIKDGGDRYGKQHFLEQFYQPGIPGICLS
jgi:hypothetical protein